MIPLVTRPISRAAVIRELDRRLIEAVGIPSPVLMEHAGHLVTDVLLAHFPLAPVAGRAPRVVILCGPGNNGGDGYVVARHLALRGVDVAAVPVFPARSPDAQVHARIAERLGLVTPVPERWGKVDLFVDAIFGTGQRAPVVVPPLPPLDAPMVALDVPTGLDADTQARVGDFPAPVHVITIGRLKPFLFAGGLPFDCVDIGQERVADAAWQGTSGVDCAPEALLVDSLTPTPFASTDTKWARGHVGVYAGSAELAGAGALAARGALRGGAGLVTLLVPREVWGRLGALPPEIMVRERTELTRYDALVVGPGLGRTADAEVRRMWAELPIPCVFDADALTALDGTPSPHPRLMTPHAGEAGRLLSTPWQDLERDRFATAARLRAIAPALYKGACTIVTGAPLRVLRGDLPSLATGGSGDVLAGLCGALLARLRPATGAAVEAVALEAAWLHLRAGGRAGPVGITASEIADALPGARG